MSEGQWAIVEIMGHRRHVGLAREAVQFGVTGILVEAVVGANLEERRAYFYPGASIFGHTLITEAEAKKEVAPPSWQTQRLLPATSSGREPTEREKWLTEVIRCATLAHDGVAAAMVSSDQYITHENRDALKRLVTIIEVGLAERHITAEGVEPTAPDDAIDGEFDDAPDSRDPRGLNDEIPC